MLGHISTKMKLAKSSFAGNTLGQHWEQTSSNTIAAIYLGRIAHLKVTLPWK
jgi:hypothetical protein